MGGGTPIWSGWGCSSEILNLPLKETNLGVAEAYADPALKETSLYELSKSKESKFFLFCYFFACNP